mmetsp:Transcript_2359/g.4666  ORF Transcript_2359/g.4666 Transcript_2359/m.4666 type:complete len:551 (-) Transcript_2359:69-1721(-)
MELSLPTGADGGFLAECAGRYKPVRTLGRGSYGTCVLVRRSNTAGGLIKDMSARDANMLRVVKVVNLLGPEEDEEGKRASEALREAEVLKALAHPNIIGYDDAFMVDSNLCIVMEYADGGDLAAAIARRREAGRKYHEREAMAIFAQLALALRHVHEQRIMHRDVKSQNIFLTSSGVAKLGDFGIAKMLATTEFCAATQIGTPHCVPPELCENYPYDFKADVWGLGVVLYELLALECPFSAKSFAALAVRICTAEPRPVPSVYSPEARALLTRLLSKRPEERPSSAEVLEIPHVRRSVAALPSSAAAAAPSNAQLASAAGAGASNARDPKSATADGGSRPATGDEAHSPVRVKRRAANIVPRRAATLPEASPPRRRSSELADAVDREIDVLACALVTPTESKLRKDVVISPKKSRGMVSPKKFTCANSPRKQRGAAPQRSMGSPKKARVLQEAQFPVLAELVSPTLGAAEANEVYHSGLSTPGSRASVTDLLASFFMDSPVGSEHREALGCCSPGGMNHVQLQNSPGRVAEDLATCTMLLNALEQDFGLA